MPRIKPPAQPRPAAAAMLNAIKSNIGMVPNFYATLAHSPAVFRGLLAFDEALEQGRLNARQLELLALAIGQANGCQYCLSAHVQLARKMGLSHEEIRMARQGRADSVLEQALLTLAVRLVRLRGVIDDEMLAEARRAGVDEELLIEVLGQVALYTFTNYVNHVANTEIDFPVVEVEL